MNDDIDELREAIEEAHGAGINAADEVFDKVDIEIRRLWEDVGTLRQAIEDINGDALDDIRNNVEKLQRHIKHSNANAPGINMELLRERYYGEWINTNISFVGADGLYYSGYLDDWYEDGSLLIDELCVVEDSYDGDRYDEKVVMNYDGMSVILAGSFVRFFITVGAIKDSDKMIGKAISDRETRWNNAAK
jgi:hypothetical protein